MERFGTRIEFTVHRALSGVMNDRHSHRSRQRINQPERVAESKFPEFGDGHGKEGTVCQGQDAFAIVKYNAALEIAARDFR
jgi:hypothetical protein